MKLESELMLTRGNWRDYAALAAHHYRGNRPATATRILTLRSPRPTVVGRYLHRRGETQTVGVLVESLPALSCKLRDEALHERYRNLAPRDRAAALNLELRCISRVIVHPQWRGLGLAVRLVRAALADPATIFTETLAAMGKVHPFFEKAGMTRYERPQHPFDARLRDALASCGIQAEELAMTQRVVERIEQLPETRRRWLLGELKRWGRTRGFAKPQARHPLTAVDGGQAAEVLRAARQRLFCEPVYFLSDNRKGGE